MTDHWQMKWLYQLSIYLLIKNHSYYKVFYLFQTVTTWNTLWLMALQKHKHFQLLDYKPRNYHFFSKDSSCIDNCPNFLPIRSWMSRNLATHRSMQTASPLAISESPYTGAIHFLWQAAVILLYISAIISISSSWISCRFCCSVFDIVLFLRGSFKRTRTFFGSLRILLRWLLACVVSISCSHSAVFRYSSWPSRTKINRQLYKLSWKFVGLRMSEGWGYVTYQPIQTLVVLPKYILFVLVFIKLLPTHSFYSLLFLKKVGKPSFLACICDTNLRLRLFHFKRQCHIGQSSNVVEVVRGVVRVYSKARKLKQKTVYY